MEDVSKLAPPRRALPWSLLLAAKLARFTLVGLTSAGIYTAVTILCVWFFGLDPKFGSTAGYLASLPFNFAAHRQYTFVASGVVWHELSRFFAVHLANIAVSIGAVSVAVDILGLDYKLGMVAVLVLIPLVTFVLMNFWVFRLQRA
jgi:putative flippase GtrA